MESAHTPSPTSHGPASASPGSPRRALPERMSAEPSLDALFQAFLERATERGGGKPPSLRDWVELAEAWRITRALRECGGNRSAAARSLGIGRRTLYSKMEKLGIAPRFTASGLEEPEGER